MPQFTQKPLGGNVNLNGSFHLIFFPEGLESLIKSKSHFGYYIGYWTLDNTVVNSASF